MNKRAISLLVQQLQAATSFISGVLAAFALSFVASAGTAFAYAAANCKTNDCVVAYSQIAASVHRTLHTTQQTGYAVFALTVALLIVSMVAKLELTKQWLLGIGIVAILGLLITVNAQALYINVLMKG